MKKFSFGRLIENKRFTMAFSILIAVIAWLVVVIQLDPMQKKVIRDIPVTYDLTDTQAEKLGLEVVKIEPANVSITVEGKRYQVSKLTQADFTVEFSAVSVQGAGSYTLELRASSKETSSEFQVANISPNTVNVTFDKVSTKTITLTAQAPNIKVADDFILENPVPTPDKLEVKGPEQYIDRLDHGIITTEASETLTQTATKKGTLLLYDADGNQLDNSWFTFDRENFEVVIPIYKQATVPLTFKYKNVPANLDTSKLEYTMSVNQIDIAGSEDAVQNVSEINLGYIDIRELDVGKTFQFNISVPSGFKNISNVTQVTVTFTDTNWSSKLLDVTDIRQSNTPSDYTITVQNSSIQNVKVVGDQSVIGSLLPNDLVATIDYTSQPIKEGSQTVQVTIEVVSKENVWVVGSYDCIVVAQKNP